MRPQKGVGKGKLKGVLLLPVFHRPCICPRCRLRSVHANLQIPDFTEAPAFQVIGDLINHLRIACRIRRDGHGIDDKIKRISYRSRNSAHLPASGEDRLLQTCCGGFQIGGVSCAKPPKIVHTSIFQRHPVCIRHVDRYHRRIVNNTSGSGYQNQIFPRLCLQGIRSRFRILQRHRLSLNPSRICLNIICNCRDLPGCWILRICELHIRAVF